jgi:DNA-binding GntR family transcriptional regulator
MSTVVWYSAGVKASEKSTSRVTEVASVVREAIYEGHHSPGTPLRELTLARSLHVSQATVREALRRLEHEGLVTRRENLGAVVTRLTPKDIRERLSLRALLEVVAARAASERMRDEHFEELERRLDALAQTLESNRYYASAQADLEFHRYVWQCSGNDTLCVVLEQLTVPLLAFISVLRSHDLHRLHDVVASHVPLVEALRSRDPLRIAEAFERGATASYEPFVEGRNPGLAAAAYGFLEGSRPSRATSSAGE